ncbi:ATP-dependent clp protease proteolytic subunit clpP [Streptomyces laurentii]|uniref:ATP-dependent clp protease proteolytic subunit clpP n=1 Tax=Streptomyces laurentii TaxID=39478 RepID=A0A169NDP4_STRLU|nr:ATP-dependent clp protease proteolytic subunit clpP [Streptomyces laurentii]
MRAVVRDIGAAPAADQEVRAHGERHHAGRHGDDHARLALLRGGRRHAVVAAGALRGAVRGLLRRPVGVGLLRRRGLPVRVRLLRLAVRTGLGRLAVGAGLLRRNALGGLGRLRGVAVTRLRGLLRLPVRVRLAP